MKRFTLFLIVCLSFLLTGCISFGRPKVIERVEYKLVVIPESYFQPIPATTPPKINEFLKLDDKQKIQALSNYSVDLLGDLKSCNIHLEDIARLQKMQRQTFYELEHSEDKANIFKRLIGLTKSPESDGYDSVKLEEKKQ